MANDHTQIFVRELADILGRTSYTRLVKSPKRHQVLSNNDRTNPDTSRQNGN